MALCEPCLRKNICTAPERAIKDELGSCLLAETTVEGKFRTGEMTREANGRVRFIGLDQVPGFHNIHNPVDNLR